MKHTFIRPLLELLVGRSLLDKLKNLYKRECQKGLRTGAADSRTWSFNSAGARGQALARLAGSDIVFFNGEMVYSRATSRLLDPWSRSSIAISELEIDLVLVWKRS